MTIVLLAYLGGVLTILSPCILPVLPFVFARADQPFLRSGLPMLVGMALAFGGVATLAAVGGAWAVSVNQYGRLFALILLAAFAATLLSRHLADWLARPFVALGNRMLGQPDGGGSTGAGVLNSALLGVATGLLWAPCAGPILGLVLTGAALSGANAQTTFLLVAYAAGAATSLAVALLAGGRIFSLLKKSLGTGEWIRRSLGVAVLLAVVAIAFGWDTGILTRVSLTGTNRVEQSLIDRIKPRPVRQDRGVAALASATKELPVEGTLPSLQGATAWLNSPPLTPASLHGKVVLVDFWTYSCINCLRSLPYVKAWYAKYRDSGLVVIGVHAPEFAFERVADNVSKAVKDLGVTYPVALDNDYAIWKGFDNQYWPAHYFIDAEGRIRGHHFGEGDYEESERTLRTLLMAAGADHLPPAAAGAVGTSGVEEAADNAHLQSPETYIGYGRAAHFASPSGVVRDRAKLYSAPAKLALNEWALQGSWRIESEKASLEAASGKIVFRFLARDLHLVFGPSVSGKAIRFRVRLDGLAPGPNHGVDIDEGGNGVVREQRLYQLIRQPQSAAEHTFSIEFMDPDVVAYSFTFG